MYIALLNSLSNRFRNELTRTEVMAAKFLSENSTPERLGEKRSEVLDFVERHKRVGRRVVLVTVGDRTLRRKTVTDALL